MVMTRSSGFGRRKLLKGSSSGKGRTFYQEGSAMGPIDVELLSSAPPMDLVPYGTSKDEVDDVPAAKTIASRQKAKSTPIESPNTKGLNPETSKVQTPPETTMLETESEVCKKIR